MLDLKKTQPTIRMRPAKIPIPAPIHVIKDGPDDRSGLWFLMSSPIFERYTMLWTAIARIRRTLFVSLEGELLKGSCFGYDIYTYIEAKHKRSGSKRI